MSTKYSILATIGLIVLAIGGGLAFLATLSNRQAARAAEPLGTGMAVLVGIGAAAIWLPWALRKRKEKLAAESKTNRGAAKRPARQGRAGR
ncbi:hypothetical protein [Alienimonas chondri]|uniref:LPXTG cell wall anchor domain-containing protein n=1 Tax=Alienimonas chondri TaxID=2681879 RepID=A0ABX1VGT8_9PLAN|nr:hypothetical protein [Alienimonas chondri]NNJ26498.1 hypothetical protein [Alienimonas chondri]